MKTSRLLLIPFVAAAAAGGIWFSSSRGATESSAPRQARGADGFPVAVVTAAAEEADMPVVKRAIGFVETPASVVIRSRIDSQILEQHVTDGQFVKKGDLLFTLDDRDIKAQIAKDEAAVARDEALHTRSESDLSRYQQLIARNAGTQQQLDQATADERSSAATIQSDKATLEADRLKLGYTRIVAPIDGRAGAVQVTPGNLVSANASGTALVTLTQMKPLRVSFTLPERDLPALQAALARGAPVPVLARIPDTDRKAAKGVLNFVDSSIDMTSGTISAKAAFANDDLSLWPGQYVEVEVDVDVLRDVPLVATVAVQPGQKGPYVYVAKGDGTVSLRSVKIALADGGRTALSEGVKPGERVVIDGQLRLKDGAKFRERDPQMPTAAPGAAAVAERSAP
ncbi:efflux RND transporter periplasmic adaptor subunit [Bosea sp. 124]|uniref:efflux RND transporter periplasmic adaptor subunit n=1 Tax=Bosea sp. 124 TaxID=2135642 RepID=UPI0015E6C4F6|nr:efflux RND transporter periplasmic adaptor subunit [Bosea sp. 124]